MRSRSRAPSSRPLLREKHGVVRLCQPIDRRLRRCRAETSLVVPLEADMTLLLALAPLSVHAASLAASLGPLDAVRFAAQPGGGVAAASAGAALDFWLIEIRANL